VPEVGRPFRRAIGYRLWLVLGAWLWAGCGNWAFSTAAAVYAFQRAGAGGVAVLAVARLLPGVLGASLSGGAVDRGDRRLVAALACVAQALCLAAAAALMFGGASIALLVVPTVGFSIASRIPRPALQALMPALAADPQELTHATAVWGAIDNGAFLLGTGGGGALIVLAGVSYVAAVAAAMLVLAAVCAFRLPMVRALAVEDGDQDDEGPRAALAGVRIVRNEPLLRVVFAVFAGLLLLEGTTDVQLVTLALGPLKLGSGGPGLLGAIWGVGGILASPLMLVLVRRRGYGLVVGGGALMFGLCLAVAAAPWTGVVILSMVPIGIGFALVETGIMSVIPRLVDDAVAGRVYALSEFLYAAAGGLGALIAPALIRALGVSGSLLAVGVAYAGGVALGWRAFGALDEGQEAATRLRQLVRGVPFLAALPLPRVERLVRQATPLDVPAGEVIVRRGDTGDSFFLIADGEVEIVEYQRRQGPGEGFGEIALLRDVPRTATVRAATDVRMWVLTRRAFVGAVSAERDAAALADETVQEHLARAAPAESAP
jgi:hypothetical protein